MLLVYIVLLFNMGQNSSLPVFSHASSIPVLVELKVFARFLVRAVKQVFSSTSSQNPVETVHPHVSSSSCSSRVGEGVETTLVLN